MTDAVGDIIRMLKADATRVSVAHWPSANLWCVTFSDGGVVLAEGQAGTYEGALEAARLVAVRKSRQRALLD